MAAVEFKKVSKHYGAISVLHELSIEIETAGMACIRGPSGCGKTTLLRLIAGLETPDSGDILIHGQSTCTSGSYVPPCARDLNMVFQDFALWPHMRVDRHLEFVLRASRIPRKERQNRISRLLDLCMLLDKHRAYPGELSGGQQQRLAIARALATRPRILLLDEPFSNLDSALRTRISDEIIQINQTKETTVILATHNPLDAESLGCNWIFDLPELLAE